METNKFSERMIKMLEMMVFAITLVVSNVVTSLILLNVVMSERFLRKYMKTVTNLTLDVTKDIYANLESEDL
jgi:hypothetical protein